MKNKYRNKVFYPRNYFSGLTTWRLVIPLLLIMGLLGACSKLPLANNPTPVIEATQSITGEPSPGATLTPGNKPGSDSVHPASATPTVEPTQAFTATASPTPTGTPTPTPAPTDTPSPQVPVVFGVIGDYGSGDEKEGDVAKLVTSWEPDIIITVGDNNYPSGAADFMDKAIGQFYHSYIFPYQGSSGDGAKENRFFPTLGNHDLRTESGKPYYDYFTLPGNERYYDFVWGPVHFFALNNIEDEPDGVNASSIQATWLQQKLSESTSPWNIVYMHYPPYSSGTHGSTDWARWPYKEWGADAVLAGHDHSYERLQVDGLTYFVNGLGGAGIYEFGTTLDGSQVRYNSNLGAMRVEATDAYMKFEFINRAGEVIDTYEMKK